MQDVVARFDFCSYLAVAVFLHAAARQVAHHVPRFAPGMLWVALATLLAVGALGYDRVQPSTATEVIGVAVVAWICAAAAALAAAVLLPPLASLRDGWRKMSIDWKQAVERQREAERKRVAREEAELARRKREEERAEAKRRDSEKPKPPTKAELIEEAKTRYEATLLLLEGAGLSEGELRAAKEKAKQKYLNELDGLLS